MSKRRHKKYYQGSLDALCGVYSLINAVRLLKPLSKEDAKQLFVDILIKLDQSEDIVDYIDLGMGTRDMHQLMLMLTDDYGIQFKKPFHRSNVTLHQVWSVISTFHNERRGVCVISIGGKDWEHWTVIEKVTNKRLVLFDSSGIKNINRKHCTLKKYTPHRPRILFPTTVYLLWSD